MTKPPWLPVMVAGAALSCSSATHLVPIGPHRPQLETPPQQVRRPPPPAVVEVLPLRRNDDCEYLDGHHFPIGTVWKWKKGRWVIPPKDCYYAPPVTRFETLRTGTALVYRAGAWLPRSRAGHSCGKPKECPALGSN